MRISLITPVFNEEESVLPFLDRLLELEQEIMSKIGLKCDIEIVFVNDGSRDRSREIIERVVRESTQVRLINLSRNFGKEAALTAGLQHATGDAVIPIDIDLQDPPEIIVEMIKRWQAGAQVVNARRVDRQRDGFIKRVSAKAFYALLEKIADQPVHPNVGDFRLLDRQVVDALNRLSESSRFNKGLFSWVGFNVDTVDFIRTERCHGTTKWSMRKLWSLAIDGLASSSTLPLRVWTYIGATIAFLTFIYALGLIAYTLHTGGDIPGYASIMVTILFLGGLNMLSLGLMGEYIGRIAIEVRRRPLYIVESTRGF